MKLFGLTISLALHDRLRRYQPILALEQYSSSTWGQSLSVCKYPAHIRIAQRGTKITYHALKQRAHGRGLRALRRLLELEHTWGVRLRSLCCH
jgi:hypothetical protein